MNWAMLIPIIAQYGLPLAEALWKKWHSNTLPTQEDWNELKALGQKTVRSQILDGLARAGIPADDPRAVAILAAIPT